MAVPMTSTATNDLRSEKKPSRSRGVGVTVAAKTVVPGNPSIKLKILVRRLPPAMTEDEFKIHTAEWIDFENLDFFSYVKGKVSEE